MRRALDTANTEAYGSEAMDSKLYEELCRRFIAREFGIPMQSVASPRIPNPQRPDMPQYVHQIDLYWEVTSTVALYLHIANAKWRGAGKIDLPDLLLLQQVRQKVAAHKAILITSTNFTAGAIAAAKDDGIGLHIVRPAFDYTKLSTTDRAVMQRSLAEVPGDLYTHTIVHRGIDMVERPTPDAPATWLTSAYATRESTGYTTRRGPEADCTNRGHGGGSGQSDGGIIRRDAGGLTRDGGKGGFERR